MFVFYFNLQLNHSTTATFSEQKKVAVMGRLGCNMTPFLYIRKVQPIYFAVAYDGIPIIM